MTRTMLASRTDAVRSLRAYALARRFSRANDALVDTVERTPRARWEQLREGTHWYAAVDALDLAQSYPGLAEFVAAVAAGQRPPRLVSEYASPSTVEAGRPPLPNKLMVADLLRRNGALVAELIVGLDDEALERTFAYFGQSLTVTHLVEELLIGPAEGCRDVLPEYHAGVGAAA
jgi:hypothetical protein